MSDATNATKKEVFLKTFKNNYGHIADACECANIDRKTYYRWMEKYPQFAQQVKEIEESFIDLAECQLRKNIKRGIQKAIEFTLTNRARDKYSNTQTVEHKVPDVVEVVHYVQQGPPPKIKEKPIGNSKTNKKQNTDTI
jgi:hypothetical protein